MIRPMPPTKSISIASATTRETALASSRRSHRPRPRCRSSRTRSTIPRTGMYDAGNWAVSASWAVPSDATSGVYLADLVRNDTGGMSQIIFVVRNDASHSNILFTTSDATWQAYNDWGGTSQNAAQNNGIWLGNSLYTGTGPSAYQGAAYAVSYNRPLNNRGNTSETNIHDQFFYAEYPMVRWLEANGYDVSYFTDVDADRSGSLIQNHKIDLSVGHDEYWSGNEFNNVMAARNAGVNLAFFSGNEVFWKTCYATSIDGSNTPDRTLVCYKETHANAVIDPNNPTIWTGTWADPRFSPPADGGQSPERADRHLLHGQPRRRSHGHSHHGAWNRRQSPLLAQHSHRPARVQSVDDHRRSGAGLRVGRRCRQRVPARRADRPVVHHSASSEPADVRRLW